MLYYLCKIIVIVKFIIKFDKRKLRIMLWLNLLFLIIQVTSLRDISVAEEDGPRERERWNSGNESRKLTI